MLRLKGREPVGAGQDGQNVSRRALWHPAPGEFCCVDECDRILVQSAGKDASNSSHISKRCTAPLNSSPYRLQVQSIKEQADRKVAIATTTTSLLCVHVQTMRGGLRRQLETALAHRAQQGRFETDTSGMKRTFVTYPVHIDSHSRRVNAKPECYSGHNHDAPLG